MKLLKRSRVFVSILLPVLAGLLLTLQTNVDQDSKLQIPLPPGIITPGDQESGSLSIVPDEKGTSKVEYRNIIFYQNAIEGYRDSESIPGDLDQSQSGLTQTNSGIILYAEDFGSEPADVGPRGDTKEQSDLESGSFAGAKILLAQVFQSNLGSPTDIDMGIDMNSSFPARVLPEESQDLSGPDIGATSDCD